MRNNAKFATAIVGLLVLAQCAPLPAAVKQCDDDDPDVLISGCTAMIESGEYAGLALVGAYNSRGSAYMFDRGDYARAVDDFKAALRIFSSDTRALYSYTLALCLSEHVPPSNPHEFAKNLYPSFETNIIIERWMQDAGYYDGPVSGFYVGSSKKAVEKWAAAGCPTSNG